MTESENKAAHPQGAEKVRFNPLLSKAIRFDRRYDLFYRLGLTPGKQVRAFDYAIAFAMAKEEFEESKEELDEYKKDASRISFFRNRRLRSLTDRFNYSEAKCIVTAVEAKTFMDRQFSEEEKPKVHVIFGAAGKIYMESLEQNLTEETLVSWANEWKQQLSSVDNTSA
jgi:hypothetical protein